MHFYKTTGNPQPSLKDDYLHGIPDERLKLDEKFKRQVFSANKTVIRLLSVFSIAEVERNAMARLCYKKICMAKVKIDLNQDRGYFKFVSSDAAREVKVKCDGRISLRSATNKFMLEYRPGSSYDSIIGATQGLYILF